MKKVLVLLALVLSTVCANAQWKVGRVKQDFKVFSKFYDADEHFSKDFFVVYSDNRNGTVTIYDYCEGNCVLGTFSNINKYIEFTGYYYAEVTDPVDDYVNVRKGPGTKYPVVGKLGTGWDILFQKTESNWLKVYSLFDGYYDDGYFENGVGFDVLFTIVDDWKRTGKPKDFHFLGYVYKNRLKTPIIDRFE